MGSHTALIEKLEQAQEGSRDLDAKFHLAMGKISFIPEDFGHADCHICEAWEDMPHYTTNLQAAVDLVPEGWGWSIEDTGYGLIYRKEKIEGEAGHPIIAETNGHGGITPSIGICILILKAVEAGDG